MENENIKQTPLHSRHVAMGAQMSPFAGYDMPIQYKGIVEEHNAVRSSCGVFDVSHMGEVIVRGAEAEMFVNRLFTNDISGIPAGKILYGMMCHPHGGVVDDLLVYKLEDGGYLLVINAANIAKDLMWIRANAAGFAVVVDNVSDKYAQIALQGPDSEKVMAELFGLDLSQMAFYTFERYNIENEEALVSRTGYTGEDGFEIYGSPELIGAMWDKIVASGKVEPCGLGCRDTLRFEVGLPLYGDELTDEISPLEASLGYFVKLDKSFIGRKALQEQKEAGLKRKLVGLELKDRAIPRHGYEVLNAEGEVIGHVTTGYRGISVDKSIAMALIDSKYAEKGTDVQVKIHRKLYPATVTAKKFFKKSYKA
ncbi:MAG: glycine cleavage system aminomethyltransferase GcvT [Muribaculaceae bacterium]|nr:glycine cleavage system aminomethyltransferase GcvT [Muribaculaceae bacterium]